MGSEVIIKITRLHPAGIAIDNIIVLIHCIAFFITLHSLHCICYIAFIRLNSLHCIHYIAIITLHSLHCIYYVTLHSLQEVLFTALISLLTNRQTHIVMYKAAIAANYRNRT